MLTTALCVGEDFFSKSVPQPYGMWYWYVAENGGGGYNTYFENGARCPNGVRTVQSWAVPESRQIHQGEKILYPLKVKHLERGSIFGSKVKRSSAQSGGSENEHQTEKQTNHSFHFISFFFLFFCSRCWLRDCAPFQGFRVKEEG